MFLALAVSSPVWVGCADYDDDIANLQSQVDGLKQSVDVTTAEAISALQSAQGELQADIDDLVSSTGITDTDVETLKGQVADLQAALDANDITEASNLSQQIQDLTSKINDEVSPDLEQVKTDLENQKKDLEGQIADVSEDLAKKEEELKQLIAQNASKEDINGLQEQITTLDGTLKKLNEDFVGVSNRFETVEKWYNTNGTELAKLTAKVTQIESLLTYLDTQKQADIDKITDPKVLAEILKLETTNTAVTTMQGQIGDATTKGTILYQLAELKGWKNNIVTELLNGTGFNTFAEVCKKINELEKALKGSGEGEEQAGLQEQLDYLQQQMEALAKIQSVVYVPNSTSAYQLSTYVLKVKNPSTNQYVEVAQSVNNNTITFRVSPASRAADFGGEHPKYELTFDGEKLSRAFSAVEINGEPTIDTQKGYVTYKVKTGIAAGSSYAVCAVIKGIDSQDDEGNAVAKDGTEITSNYFLATCDEDLVDQVKITSNNSSKAEMPYEMPDGSASSINYGEGLVVEGQNAAGRRVVEDLVAKYGVPTTIEYTSDDTHNWFQVSAEGVLTLKNPSNAMIGRSVTVTPVAVFGNIRLVSTTPFAQVTVTRRVVEHHVAEVKNITWKNTDQYIALTTDEMDAIINATELSRGDFNELYTQNQPASRPTTIALLSANVLKANASSWGITLPTEISSVSGRDNTLYLYIPAGANVNAGGNLVVTLYDGSSSTSGSTTQTDSYVIDVDYNAMTYPVTSIEWNSARWNGGKDVELEYLPQITVNNGKVSAVGDEFDAKDLFANYSELKKKVEELGAELVVAMENSVTGIEEVTTPKDDEIYKYLKDTYDGTPMKINIYIDYNGHKEAENSCVVSTANLSGTWQNPSQMNLEVTNLSQEYNIAQGAEWRDVQGRLMWENGEENSTAGFETNASPFSPTADGYYMTQPEFSIVKVQGQDATSCEYIDLDKQTGKFTFTDVAKQLTFAEDYQVVIRIKADSPWGPISGLTDDYVDVTLTIKQGAKAY